MKKPYPLGKEYWQAYPRPVRDVGGDYSSNWNSVALFFNLPASSPPSFTRPGGYVDTSVTDVKKWLSVGDPSVSHFLVNYWGRLTYGQFGFGIDTPRNDSGEPIIPTIEAPPKWDDPTKKDPLDWGGLIRQWLKKDSSYLQKIWNAAGNLKEKDKRLIPSIVLVNNYAYSAHAVAGNGFNQDVNADYVIGHVLHIPFTLSSAAYSGMPSGLNVRDDLGTLCHEFSHNFFEFGDLYGAQGCTGYWDMLGDNSPPGRMSEVSSILKERIGWIAYDMVIEGPTYAKETLTLDEYTRTGRAIKVIPDPKHNPSEYFVLEYRKSISTEPWIPDGGLDTNEGLFIIHINERFGGVANTSLLRDAPFFDPEYADFSDKGSTLWTDYLKVKGAMFPYGTNKAFTHSTKPSSDFYGPRHSGISITNIELHKATPPGGHGMPPLYPHITFDLEINGYSRAGWDVSNRDRCASGNFTPDSKSQGQEIFCRNDTSVALLEYRQAQWFVRERQDGKIDGWSLGSNDRECIGDFDGDGLDEVYVRSPKYAGILKWIGSGFRAVTIQYDGIEAWKLGSDNHELVGDFDSDGIDEIFIRSPAYAGIFKLQDGRLKLQRIQATSIDKWLLSGADKEVVGRFTQANHHDILIRSPKGWGLLGWENITSTGEPVDAETPIERLVLKNNFIQEDRIGGWRLDINNNLYVGDFDGDSIDEIYIRSPNFAGVIKWIGDRFRVLWMTDTKLESLTNSNNSLVLSDQDRSYAGRFLVNRDGIFHQSNNRLGIVTFEGGKMIVRNSLPNPVNGAWQISTKNDNCVVGEFHYIGAGVNLTDPTSDYITDGIADIFMHNSWGTGTVGFNLPSTDPSKPNPGEDEFGLTWINEKEILYRLPH